MTTTTAIVSQASPMLHSLPKPLDTYPDGVGLTFSDMDVDQQARAMQIAFQDPMGWTYSPLPHQGREVLSRLSHPLGLCIICSTFNETISLTLHDAARIDVNLDPDALTFASKHTYASVALFSMRHSLPLPLSKTQTEHGFGLADWRRLLVCNFSPEGRALLQEAHQLVMGYVLTCAPTAHGTGHLSFGAPSPVLKLDSMAWVPYGLCPQDLAKQLDHLRTCRHLLAHADMPGLRVRVGSRPFSLVQRMKLSFDLPASAHARAAALRAYTEWRKAHPVLSQATSAGWKA